MQVSYGGGRHGDAFFSGLAKMVVSRVVVLVVCGWRGSYTMCELRTGGLGSPLSAAQQ